MKVVGYLFVLAIIIFFTIGLIWIPLQKGIW